jgi:transcriptional regulator GlxA family with amidase domain
VDEYRLRQAVDPRRPWLLAERGQLLFPKGFLFRTNVRDGIVHALGERTSQSIYSIPNHLANADPLTQQFERWARRRLAKGFSLDQAAKALGTSKRTLARRMESVLGKSPLAFFQDLRIERV